MSASEKLQALGEHGTPAPWNTAAKATQTQVRGPDDSRVAVRCYSADAALVVMLRNALPQIVAVVEAAERAERYDYCDADDGDGLCSDIDGRWAEWRDIGSALAALDDALSPRGSTDTIGTRG